MVSIIDAHVHVGRFRDAYFDPVEVGQFLLRQGVIGCVASATVAAIGRHEEAVRDLERLMSVVGLAVWPLLWVTPGLLAKHPDLAGPLRRLPYRGLKIHPRANKWSEAMLDRTYRVAEEKPGFCCTPAGLSGRQVPELLARHPCQGIGLGGRSSRP